jgi:hypothetical protein
MERLASFLNCSHSFSQAPVCFFSLFYPSREAVANRTLKLSLGGIGASLAAAAAGARGGMPEDELLLGAAATEASGAAAFACDFAAMPLLSAEATFLPAARAGEGWGEGERGGEADAAGSLAGQSGRIGGREAGKKRETAPSDRKSVV